MQARSLALSLVAMAALTACQVTETPEQMRARMQMESDSARVALEARAAAFSAAMNAKDYDAVAAFYAPDAVVMAPDAPAVTGREAIRAMMASPEAQMPEGAVFNLEVMNVMANGPLAVERGVWTTTMTGPDGGSMTLRGKYLVEWHRIDGEWLMVSDIWNADAPTPPMPTEM